MKYFYHLVRLYPFSVVLFLLIWYLSFFTPPKTDLDNIAFVDKWVHIVMYLVACSALWIEYIHYHKNLNITKLISMAWFAPIVMSGIIELLQEYCTNGKRSGDWYDLVANSIGVSLAVVIGLLWAHWYSKERKAS